MRLRLILSFTLVALVAVVSLAVLARQGAVQEVRAFMFPGGMLDSGELAATLQGYYAENGSWSGVESLFTGPGRRYGWGQGGQGMGPMHGMMMGGAQQRLRLADQSGALIFDSQNGNVPRLTEAELAASQPLQVRGQTVGYLLAEGGMTYNAADEALLLSRITRAAWIAGLIAAGLALLLGLLLAEALMRPVRTLTAAARRLGEGDLSQRVPISGDGELAALGQAFNRMAASLQTAQDSRRALTADIAHELRTPLAVQRAQLEALQDGVYPLTADNLAPALEQNHTLARLVDDLRTLALADAGALKLERTSTDLHALAARLVERFRPAAAARRIDLLLEPPIPGAPAMLAALDPLRVEQILSNLLSNALRHAPEGGRILLRLAVEPGRLRLAVQDNGPGIPADALPHIFERFYRAGRSRSRTEGGAGLGLAIARRLAELHGGSLEAANLPQGGAVFTLSLPEK